MSGRSEVVCLLMKAVVNVEAEDNYGRTALMEAAMSGHNKVVQLLIEAGADTSALK
jgi:ankyrin repeat protein